MHERVIKNLRYYREGLKSHSVYVGESYLQELILLASKPKPFYRHWDSHTFVFTSLSSVKGKVIDFEGKIPPQQFLWLLPVDDNGKTYLYSPPQYTWMNPANGKFVFENVPKGKYRIAINPYNCHADRNPEYGKNFFPGVFNENDAEVITIDENQTLRLKDFRLSQPLKERWFSGIVFAADKSPLANATVFMHNRGQTISNDCSSATAEIKTDEFGRLKIKGYESYPYQIRAYTETKSENQTNSRLYSKMFEISEKGNIENIELIVDSLY